MADDVKFLMYMWRCQRAG